MVQLKVMASKDKVKTSDIDPGLVTSEEQELSLNINNLRDVIHEVYEVRAKWRRIGVELNLTPGTLDAIEQRSQDPADRMERVLIEWLNKGTATWRELVDALFSVPVGETKLSRQLERKFCSECLYTVEFEDELWREKEHNDNEKQQLSNDIRDIQKQFSKLQISTRGSLKRRNVPCERLVDHLMDYQYFQSVMTKSSTWLLDKQADLENANSIDEIFKIASSFWSFLDFELLQDVINNKDLGDDGDRQNLEKYITSLNEFLDSWRVEQHKVSRHDSGSLESRAKLHFKLDTDSLSRYRNVKAAIARILEIKVHELQLYSIDKGCTELVFLSPNTVTTLTFSSEKNEELFQIKPSVLKVALEGSSDIERVLFEREHYTPESEMFRPVSSRTPKVTGSEGNRRGWLRRLFSGWRWPWSRPRSTQNNRRWYHKLLDWARRSRATQESPEANSSESAEPQLSLVISNETSLGTVQQCDRIDWTSTQPSTASLRSNFDSNRRQKSPEVKQALMFRNRYCGSIDSLLESTSTNPSTASLSSDFQPRKMTWKHTAESQSESGKSSRAQETSRVFVPIHV